MSGIPAALAASTLWGAADFLGGRASRTAPATTVALIGQSAGLATLLIIVLIAGSPHSGAYLPGAAAGLTSVVSVLCFYRALAIGTMSVVAPIVATSAAVPVLAGVLQGDRTGALQWIGVACAFGGVVLAAREPATEAARSRAIPFALLAAVMLGLQLVLLNRAAKADAMTGVAASRTVSVTILAGIAVARGRRPSLREVPGLAAIGLLDTAANVAFALATTGGLLALIAILASLYPIVTVMLAYIFLGERVTGLQRIGIVLALAGATLISGG